MWHNCLSHPTEAQADRKMTAVIEGVDASLNNIRALAIGWLSKFGEHTGDTQFA